MSWDGGWSGSGAVIVGFRNGNRIVRVSPDTLPHSQAPAGHKSKQEQSSDYLKIRRQWPHPCKGISELTFACR